MRASSSERSKNNVDGNKDTLGIFMTVRKEQAKEVEEGKYPGIQSTVHFLPLISFLLHRMIPLCLYSFDADKQRYALSLFLVK